MKKLIIAAAIVCAAAISQAAAVGWTCTAASWKNCDYSVFVVGLNGVTSTDQIKAIVAAGGLDSANSYAFASGLTASGTGTANVTAENSGKSITFKPKTEDETDEQWKAKNTYSMFLVFEDAKGENASYTASKTLTLENDSTSKTVSFSNQNTNLNNNKFAVAPEPTSGLLLLLGVAGLALKRRRA